MPSPSVIFALFGLIIALLAVPLVLRRVPPNPIYGLRVPATFRDESVWYDANAAAGRDMLVLGLLVFVVALVVPLISRNPWALQVTWIALAAGGSLVIAILGWRRANRMLRERSHTS